MKEKKYFCDWYEENKWISTTTFFIIIIANSTWLFLFFWETNTETFVGAALSAVGISLVEYLIFSNIIDKKRKKSQQKKEDEEYEEYREGI